MPWDDRYVLGVVDMDTTHEEFVTLVDALAAAPDAAFPALFARLQEHTRSHFENEARVMRACRFPAIGEHEGEHLRVLGELAHLGQRIAGGRLAMARAYVEACRSGSPTTWLPRMRPWRRASAGQRPDGRPQAGAAAPSPRAARAAACSMQALRTAGSRSRSQRRGMASSP